MYSGIGYPGDFLCFSLVFGFRCFVVVVCSSVLHDSFWTLDGISIDSRGSAEHTALINSGFLVPPHFGTHDEYLDVSL